MEVGRGRSSENAKKGGQGGTATSSTNVRLREEVGTMSIANGKHVARGLSHPDTKGGTAEHGQPSRRDVRHFEAQSEHGESAPESVVVQLITESPGSGDGTYTRVEFRLPYGIQVSDPTEHGVVLELHGDVEHRSMVSALEFLVDTLRMVGHTPARWRV